MTDAIPRKDGELVPVADPAAPLGTTVGRGATILMAAASVLRILNFLGQIVLGTMLLDRDFGLFAIANSVAAFVVVLQDGGMRTLIVQRGESEFEELEGPAFWLGFAFNLAAASLLAAMAPLVSLLYAEPKLAPMLWVIALAILLNSFSAVSLARLRMDMRFGALSVVEVLSGVVRYGGMVVGALLGLGAMAFVAPLPVIAVVEILVGYLFTRRTPWMRPLGTNRWSGLIGASSWLVISSVAGSALYLGSHMALGLTASTALVGMYFFGYSIVQQSGYLIISTAEGVLLPVFSRLRAETQRQRSAVLRTLRAICVLGFSACAVIGALFPSLEHLIWKGKWAGATGVVQVMAICYTLFTLHIIARCVVTGRGHFRAHALSVAIAGVMLMLVAAAAGAITADLTAVAWINGVAMILVSLTYLGWGVWDLGIRPMELLREILPIAVCGVAALMTGMLVDHAVQAAIFAREDHPLAESFWQRFAMDGPRLAATAGSSAIVLAILLRVVVPNGLRESIDVLPNRLRRAAHRLFKS